MWQTSKSMTALLPAGIVGVVLGLMIQSRDKPLGVASMVIGLAILIFALVEMRKEMRNAKSEERPNE